VCVYTRSARKRELAATTATLLLLLRLLLSKEYNIIFVKKIENNISAPFNSFMGSSELFYDVTATFLKE